MIDRGEGPSDVDVLAALEAWVEDGIAPERLIASKRLDGGGTVTRPLCAYPSMAEYEGPGDTDDAGSFQCRIPAAR